VPSRYCTSCIGCQSSSGSHEYKLAVLTSLQGSEHIHSGLRAPLKHGTAAMQSIRSSAVPLLVQPFTRTDFSRRVFQLSVPSVCNSQPQAVLISESVCF